MTIAEALAPGTLPKLDLEVLLAWLMKQNRAWLITHADLTIPTQYLSRWHSILERRRNHEPVAYIIGEKEFYGRVFNVNRHTLIPRPATEGLISVIKEFMEDRKNSIHAIDTDIVATAKNIRDGDIQTIVDIGTGSGCIAITLALEFPAMKIIATDISESALQVAKQNAKLHGVAHRISFLQGSLLEPIKHLRESFLIVSNPPYIPADTELMPDVQKYEPESALFAGKEGTDVLKPLAEGALAHPFCRGYVFECRKEQAQS